MQAGGSIELNRIFELVHAACKASYSVNAALTAYKNVPGAAIGGTGSGWDGPKGNGFCEALK